MKTLIVRKNENQPLRIDRFNSIKDAKATGIKIETADWYLDFSRDFTIEHKVFDPDSREAFPNNLEEKVETIQISEPTRVYFWDTHFYFVDDSLEV